MSYISTVSSKARPDVSGRALRLGVLEGAVEHGEDDLLFGFGEALEALQAALELRGGPALGGRGAGDAEQDVGGHTGQRRQLRHERDGEPEPADFVVGERLLRDAELRGEGVLREAGLLAERGQAAAQRFGDRTYLAAHANGGVARP